MPTKKGKSKPAKARKTSNKARRPSAAGGKRPSKRSAGAARKKKPAGRLRRTEAGPVWIGSSPALIIRPDQEPGDRKAGDGGSERVSIL